MSREIPPPNMNPQASANEDLRRLTLPLQPVPRVFYPLPQLVVNRLPQPVVPRIPQPVVMPNRIPQPLPIPGFPRGAPVMPLVVPPVKTVEPPFQPQGPIIPRGNQLIPPVHGEETAEDLLPTVNPYPHLPQNILQAIAQERDVHLSGTPQAQAEQLHAYDQIIPDWINSVTRGTLHSMAGMSQPKLMVFAVINGVNMRDLEELRERDVFNYVRIFLLLQQKNTAAVKVLVMNTSRPVLSRLCSSLGLTGEQCRFLSDDKLREVVLTQSVKGIDLQHLAALEARYQRITTSPHVNELGNLYDVQTFDDWTRVVQQPPHPLEEVILNLNQYSDQQLIDAVGMVVPKSFAHNIRGYIVENLPFYKDIFTRAVGLKIPTIADVQGFSSHHFRRTLNIMTDNEIFKHYDAYVPYDSRLALIDRLPTLVQTPSFFYPLTRARARNTDTICGTEVTDQTVFMIAYGTLSSYYLYELLDLIGAFSRIDGMIHFRHPEDNNLMFTNQEIEALLSVLSSFEDNDDSQTLRRLIDEGLIDANERTQYDDDAQRQLRLLPQKEQEEIRTLLRQIFHTGMYMRQWRGPGHPFPLNTEDTRRHGWTDAIVQEQLGLGFKMMINEQVATFCRNLRCCQYRPNGTVEVKYDLFGDLWDRVVTNNKCIREASSIFVGTGYHYLRVLFHETIPEVNVQNIDRIQ